MRRFIVYIKLRKKYVESIVAEGVEFTNENIALHEFLTTTILILDSMESIYKHYEPLGKIRIKWLDFDNFDKKVH
jgi:hypothetical protein